MKRAAIAFAIISILLDSCASEISQKSASTSIASEHTLIKVDGSRDGLHVFREASLRFSSSSDTIRGPRLMSIDTHEVIFVVHQRNMDELTRILHDVSDPTSSNYGNHLTRQDIINLTSNPNSCEEVVAYLTNAGATVVKQELSTGFITARGNIGLWERMLNTEFHSYSFRPDHGDNDVEFNAHDNRKFMRTDKYFVPSCLDGHIASILNTIDMPVMDFRRIPPTSVSIDETSRSSRFSKTNRIYDNYVTPQLIANAYGIDDKTGHPLATQASFAGWGNYFCPEDLTRYQDLISIPIKAINRTMGGDTSRSTEWCRQSELTGGGKCQEGNLDTQLLMGMADTPTIFYYTNYGSFSQFTASLIARETALPLVLSISYGGPEDWHSEGERNAFNTNAMKLGVMGVTIVVAAGDDGVSLSRQSAKGCRYMSIYPGSSPYVLSAGGTQVSLDMAGKIS